MAWPRRSTTWRSVTPTAAAALFGLSLLVNASSSDSWNNRLSQATLQALTLGALAGWTFHRDHTRQLATLFVLPDTDQDAAWDAARTSTHVPVPAPGPVRDGAARLIQHRLQDWDKGRALTLYVLAVIALIALGLAIAVSPWWLGMLMAAAGLAGGQLLWARRLRRRLTLLLAADARPAPEAQFNATEGR